MITKLFNQEASHTMVHSYITLSRPDLIDLLFPGSVTDPYQRIEMNKNKRKNTKSWMKCKMFWKIVFYKIMFWFPDLSQCFIIMCKTIWETQINSVWPYCFSLLYRLTMWNSMVAICVLLITYYTCTLNMINCITCALYEYSDYLI